MVEERLSCSSVTAGKSPSGPSNSEYNGRNLALFASEGAMVSSAPSIDSRLVWRLEGTAKMRGGLLWRAGKRSVICCKGGESSGTWNTEKIFDGM